MKFEIAVDEKEARKLLAGLIVFEFILVAIYLLIHIVGDSLSWGPLRGLFDLDSEIAIPTWFSAILSVVAAAVLFAIAKNNQQKSLLPSSYLTAGGIVLVFLSADDSAVIHERITVIAKQLDLNFIIFKGGHGTWIYIYAILGVVALFLSMRALRVLWSHFRREFWIMLCAVFIFLAGAVGLEIYSYWFLRSETVTTLYEIEVAIEEFLEMGGVSLFLYAALLLNIKLSKPIARD